MILVLMGLVGFGIFIYFEKNFCDEEAMMTLLGTFFLIIGVIAFVSSNGIQYEDYSESCQLQQMSNGNYYSISANKVNVIILDGNMQKPKTFSSETISFVNGNTASVQIQGERTSNNDMLKKLFFCEVKEKDTVKSVILSVPETNVEKPLTEGAEESLTGMFCTSCGLRLRKQTSFAPAADRKLNQNNKKGRLDRPFSFTKSQQKYVFQKFHILKIYENKNRRNNDAKNHQKRKKRECKKFLSVI